MAFSSQDGSDEDVDLPKLVASFVDEYTSDYIDAAELLDATRTDPLGQKELTAHHTAVA